MLELLILLFIVMVVVTLVGHGLWCLTALCFRALSDASPSAAPQRCTKCGQTSRQPVSPGSVTASDGNQTSQLNARELSATARQLERFRVSGELSEPQFRLLQQLVAERQHALVAQSPSTADEGIVLASTTQPKPALQSPHALPAGEPPATGSSKLQTPRPVFLGTEKPGAATDAAGMSDVVEAEIVRPRSSPAILPERPQQTHPLDRVQADEMQSQPPRAIQPRRTLADWLQAFMEEKNIRWGELLSGLLIVGSAVGLIVSLRHTLSHAIPYFPALLFMLGTAAIHAAGNYTLRRWKLESTSRGVLLIATLLIPLNFLAAIVISNIGDRQLPVDDPRYIIAVSVGLLTFGTMAYFASRTLMRDGWWRMWIAVMGTSAGQLLMNRLARPEMSLLGLLTLWILPASAFFAATVHQLWRARDWQRLTSARADQLLVLLGVSTFSLATVLALIVYQTPDAVALFTAISPLIAALGTLLLSYGLLIHFRATSRQLTKIRTAGTTLAIIAGIALAGSVILAWPQPVMLFAVGLTLFVTLTCLAMMGRLPWLHAGALAGGTLSTLVGVHWVAGHLAPADSYARALLASCFTDETSVTLTVLAILVGTVAWWSSRTKRPVESLVYAWASASLAGLGVLVAAIASLSAWPLPNYPLATLVFLANAVALLQVSRHLRVRWIAWCGSALLLTGLVHAVMLNTAVETLLAQTGIQFVRPVVLATLVHAIITTTIAAVVWRNSRWQQESTRDTARQSYALPQLHSALVSASATLPFIMAVAAGQFGVHTIYLATVAGVWLTAAVMTRSQSFFAVFQTLSAGTVVLLVCWLGVRFQWWNVRVSSVTLMGVQLSALAVWCMLWIFLRRRLSQSVRWRPMLGGPEITVERVLLRAMTIVVASLAVSSCLPSVVSELGQRWTEPSWAVNFSAGFLSLCISFGLVIAATIVAMVRRPTTNDVIWLLLILFSVPWLCLSQGTGAGNTTVLLSLSMAILGLLSSVVYACRRQLLRFSSRIRFDTTRLAAGSPDNIRTAILLFSGLPLLLLIMGLFANVLRGGTIDYAFLTIAAPLLAAALMFVVFALSDGKTWFMLSGSATVLAGVVLGCAAQALVQQHLFDLRVLIEIVQWSSIAMGLYSLGWLALQRTASSLAAAPRNSMLDCQIAIAAGLPTTIVAAALIGIVASPTDLAPVVAMLGQPLSYVATATVLAAVFWHVGLGPVQHRVHAIGACIAAFGVLLAASMASTNSAEDLISYHVLEVASLIIGAAAAIGLCFVDLRGREKTTSSTEQRSSSVGHLLSSWGSAAGLGATLLALRVYTIEPHVGWSLTVLGICTAVTIAVGLVRGSTPHAVASLFLVAATITLSLLAAPWSSGLDVLLSWNLVGLSLTASVWLASTIWHQRREQGNRGASPRVHQWTLTSGCISLTILAIFGFLTSATGFHSSILAPRIVALIGLLGLAVFSLWQRRCTLPLPCLYMLGFAALFLSLDHLAADQIGWKASVVGLDLGAAVLVALAGFLLSKRRQLSSLAHALRIPAAMRGDSAQSWLPAVNLVVSAAAVLLSLSIVSGFEMRTMRFAAASVPLICGLGFVFTARQVRNGRIRFVSILLLASSIVLVGWADMSPRIDASSLLERCVRLLISLSASVMLFLVAARRLPERSAAWRPTLRKAAALLGSGALAVLLIVLGVELAAFVPGQGAPVNHPYQIVAVAMALAGLVVALLAIAVRPLHDPLDLPEKGRMYYVYAAEAVAALFFAHMYLVKPMWFELVHARFWPFGMMALAFAGVGVGELCERVKLNVLAEPLRRTAVFLPLIPVTAFWVLAGNDRLSFQATGVSYAAVLVIVGLLYVMISVLRRSFASAVAAAVAGNAALWVFFHDNAFHIAQHPQFWLIPPALSLLAASHINRRSLPLSTLTAIRYACILLIYLSSTAEMIIESASEQLWPPMVLAALALTGAFAGVILRVRAFLYIGSTFVLLSVVSMVWHAARAIEHVWPWWAFGMVTGLFILSLFGFFELKRTEVTRLIQRLRQWER